MIMTDNKEDAMEQGKKILLVDDDSDFRASTRKILESGGYVVVEAATGQEGFAKAKSESPDIGRYRYHHGNLQRGL